MDYFAMKHKRRIFLFAISIFMLAVLAVIVYAPMSIYLEGTEESTYKAQSYEYWLECPDFNNPGATSCTTDNLPCKDDGQYYGTVWVHGGSVTKPLYFVDFDADEDYCENADCGNAIWNELADFQEGECCGDDSGMLVKEWTLKVTIDEEDIPTDVHFINNTESSFEYEGTIPQQHTTKFQIKEKTLVGVSFIIRNCYLPETVLYANITDESGNTIYSYYTEQCERNVKETQSFNANPGLYSLNIYKGQTAESQDSDFGKGFAYVSLKASFDDYYVENRTEKLYFFKIINKTGKYIFDLVSQYEGILNKGTIERYVIPTSFASPPTNVKTKVIEVGKHIEEIVLVDIADSGTGEDCGLVYSGVICLDSYNLPGSDRSTGTTEWDWLWADDYKGAIIDMECLGMSSVSDGFNWHACRDPDREIPEGTVDFVHCEKISGYVVDVSTQYEGICHKRIYDPQDCTRFNEYGKCLIEPSADVYNPSPDDTCPDYQDFANDKITCKQSQCMVLEDCEPGLTAHCGDALKDTYCGSLDNPYVRCDSGGNCIDHRCSASGGTCCDTSTHDCGGQIGGIEDCGAAPCCSSCELKSDTTPLGSVIAISLPDIKDFETIFQDQQSSKISRPGRNLITGIATGFEKIAGIFKPETQKSITGMATGDFSEPFQTPYQSKLLDFEPNPLNVLNHDYLCYDGGIKYTIAECYGDGTRNSDIGGVSWGGEKVGTGHSRDTANGRYYCTTYGNFTTDLDYTNKDSCEKALLPDGKTSEELIWTGTLCCGEADDPEEFYNDIGGLGGCWDNKVIGGTGDYADEIMIPEVVNYDGEFLGCAINETNDKPDNQYLLQINDLHTGNQLINDTGFCTVLDNRQKYCHYKEEWVRLPADWRNYDIVLSSAPVTMPVQRGCCPSDSCWDGKECIGNQADDNTFKTYFDDYRCYDGQWGKVRLKPNWDNSEIGYCPREDQCFVTNSGSAVSSNNGLPDKFYTVNPPFCINDSQYFLDSYCEKGNWTSRTRQIALAMLDKIHAENIEDYSLYCDNYTRVLPDQEMIPEQCQRGDYLWPCINNVCMLNYKDSTGDNKILIGISYNAPINDFLFKDDPISSLCIDEQQQQSQHKFVDCTGDNTVWYNHDIEAIIYNRYLVNGLYLENKNWIERLGALLKHKIMGMLEHIRELDLMNKWMGNIIRTDYITDTSDFDRIFLKKAGNKEITAIAGDSYDYAAKQRQAFIAVSYKGFSEGTDICRYIDEYDKRFHVGVETVICNKDENDYYIFSPYPLGEEIWQDMTSKLRFE